MQLFKNYRGTFPFRLATTSYIYPDYILSNARRLASYLDEIELILFESQNLPTGEEISALAALHAKQGLSYNVHLPLDIFLGHPAENKRKESIARVGEAINLTEALNPSTYTLHYLCADYGKRDLLLWQKHIAQSTEAILETGLKPQSISIETLDYPFIWVEDIINDFGLSICLDLGHIIKNGGDPRSYLDKYLEKTTVIHMHGVHKECDHLGLEVLDEAVLVDWLRALEEYKGTLSLEVFSLDYLKSSLLALEKAWTKI